MKKLITLAIVIISFSVYANPVDKKLAEQIALNQYAQFSPTSIRNYSIVDVFETTYEGIATFYTYTFESGGFVIVSADDASLPILAYSFDGIIDRDKINPAAKAWLEKYSHEIFMLSQTKVSNAKTRPLWDKILNNEFERSGLDVEPLVKSEWDQGCGYNTLCPEDISGDCEKSWTGCVATTMAALMHYHEWPNKGIGYHSYNHPLYGLQSANFNSSTYDYSLMPNSVSGRSAEVDTLMYHAGVSVNMNYDSEGSGAYSQDVPFALINYFNYAPSCRVEAKSQFTLDNWYALLRDELDARRPVYYSGSSEKSGGHAWILDGYRLSDNKFHFNWGWSGYYNGYFAIGSLNPGEQDFNDESIVIVGITPGNNQVTLIEQNAGFVEHSRGINYMHVVNEEIAWGSAYDGVADGSTINEYTRTSNGGKSWTSGTVVGGNQYGIGNICGVSDSIAYVALYNSEGDQDDLCGVYKTINGGTTWSHLVGALQGAASFANNVYFWNELVGMCHGDVKDGFFEIYTTNNGGSSWQRVPSSNITGGTAVSGEGGWTYVIQAVGENTIMFGTNKGKLYISHDRGAHWKISDTEIKPTSGGGINHIAFTDPDNGIVVQTTTTVEIKRTADGGETWHSITPTGSFFTNHIMPVPGSNGTYISTGAGQGSSGMSFSTDGGLSWVLFPGTLNKQFLAGDFHSNSCGYVGGFSQANQNSGIYRMLGTMANAHININPGGINETAQIDETIQVPLTIVNYSDSPLQWDLTFNFAPGWISSDLTAGTIAPVSSANLSITLDANNLTAGKYNAVIVMNSNNSTTKSTIEVPVIFTVKNKTFTSESNFLIYPNPVSDILTVEGKYEITQMTLINTAGRIIMQSNVNKPKFSLNVSDIPSGIYFIKLTTPAGVELNKISIK